MNYILFTTFIIIIFKYLASINNDFKNPPFFFLTSFVLLMTVWSPDFFISIHQHIIIHYVLSANHHILSADHQVLSADHQVLKGAPLTNSLTSFFQNFYTASQSFSKNFLPNCYTASQSAPCLFWVYF